MTLELHENRPSGFHTRERVFLSAHDDLETAWSALLEEHRLFHEQLRANAEGAGTATIQHVIADTVTGDVLIAAHYTPGQIHGPFTAAIAPPWAPHP